MAASDPTWECICQSHPPNPVSTSMYILYYLSYNSIQSIAKQVQWKIVAMYCSRSSASGTRPSQAERLISVISLLTLHPAAVAKLGTVAVAHWSVTYKADNELIHLCEKRRKKELVGKETLKLI